MGLCVLGFRRLPSQERLEEISFKCWVPFRFTAMDSLCILVGYFCWDKKCVFQGWNSTVGGVQSTWPGVSQLRRSTDTELILNGGI